MAVEMKPPLPPLTFEISPTWVLHHGERGTEMDADHPEACLCGRFAFYMACPEYLADDGISGVTLIPGPAYMGDTGEGTQTLTVDVLVVEQP